MTLKINSLAPDFTAETSEGKLSLHEWLGDSGVFYFHIQKILHQFAQLNLVH